MNILTPTGYIPIEDIQVGDKVLAYDVFTGEKIENEVLEKHLMVDSPETYYSMCKFYRINDTWTVAGDLSIWRNDNVVFHVSELEIGDVIFNGEDQDVVVTSIEEVTGESWWRFEISGDHSYIVDNLTLHNASRFWVGGTGTWSSGSTANWSATSGGASGSSVPGAADTVTFDGSSGGGTITLNYVPSITSLTGGSHTGTFDTGNNNMTLSGSFTYSGTGVRSLILGTSTITTAGSWDLTTQTNLTFSGASATIIKSSGQNSSFISSGLTYGAVQMSGGLRGTGNTYGTFTYTTSSNSQCWVEAGGTHTVTGTCTFQGSSATNYGLIVGSGGAAGVMRNRGTFAFNAATVVLNNVVIGDLVAGGAGSWTGTNVGDAGNCTGVTFTAPVTRYWVDTNGGSWNVTSSWSATSGGASGASIPLPQDTVVFDSNSITVGGSVITANHSCCGNVDFSNITNNPTLTWTVTNGSQYILGNIKLKSGMTLNGTSTLYFMGAGDQTLDMDGVAYTGTASSQFTINNATKLTFLNNFTGTSTGTLGLIAGGIDTNGYNLTIGAFSSSNSNTRAITMGNSIWTLNGTGTVWTTATVTGLTMNAGNSTIVISDTSATGKTFTGSALIYNNITFSGDNITVSGNNTFANFRLANAGLTTGVLMTAGSNTTLRGSLTNNGTVGNLTKLLSTVAGSAFTFTKAGGIVGIGVDYMSLKDSTATGGATFYAGANSTNVSGNTGWSFTTAPNRSGFMMLI